LEAISQTAASIEQGQLDARIANPASGDEVEALVRTLNHTFAELQSSFRRIEQFSADAAHELRTPLTAMRGNLEVCLRQRREPAEYEEAMAVAVEEIARLNQIIDQLLMMARSPEQIGQDDFEPVDLSELIRNTCAQCEILAESAELSLQVDIADHVYLRGAPALLGQLCHNLIQNAIKFSEPGGVIHVSLDAKGCLTVRDEGIGIAPEHLEAVFERFFQVSPGREHGSGLGLAMVRWIASLHHGQVALESQEGRGTSVTVTLR
jgi:two-component system heavy metal sensor histidine kinase CusS